MDSSLLAVMLRLPARFLLSVMQLLLWMELLLFLLYTGTSGTVGYVVTGTSPNRQLQIYWNGGTGSNSERFYLTLNEHASTTQTADLIQFSYSDQNRN